jgi:hypothetical protein
MSIKFYSFAQPSRQKQLQTLDLVKFPRKKKVDKRALPERTTENIAVRQNARDVIFDNFNRREGSENDQKLREAVSILEESMKTMTNPRQKEMTQKLIDQLEERLANVTSKFITDPVGTEEELGVPYRDIATKTGVPLEKVMPIDTVDLTHIINWEDPELINILEEIKLALTEDYPEDEALQQNVKDGGIEKTYETLNKSFASLVLKEIGDKKNLLNKAVLYIKSLVPFPRTQFINDSTNYVSYIDGYGDQPDVLNLPNKNVKAFFATNALFLAVLQILEKEEQRQSDVPEGQANEPEEQSDEPERQSDEPEGQSEELENNPIGFLYPAFQDYLKELDKVPYLKNNPDDNKELKEFITELFKAQRNNTQLEKIDDDYTQSVYYGYAIDLANIIWEQYKGPVIKYFSFEAELLFFKLLQYFRNGLAALPNQTEETKARIEGMDEMIGKIQNPPSENEPLSSEDQQFLASLDLPTTDAPPTSTTDAPSTSTTDAPTSLDDLESRIANIRDNISNFTERLDNLPKGILEAIKKRRTELNELMNQLKNSSGEEREDFNDLLVEVATEVANEVSGEPAQEKDLIEFDEPIELKNTPTIPIKKSVMYTKLKKDVPLINKLLPTKSRLLELNLMTFETVRDFYKLTKDSKYKISKPLSNWTTDGSISDGAMIKTFMESTDFLTSGILNQIKQQGKKVDKDIVDYSLMFIDYVYAIINSLDGTNKEENRKKLDEMKTDLQEVN